MPRTAVIFVRSSLARLSFQDALESDGWKVVIADQAPAILGLIQGDARRIDLLITDAADEPGMQLVVSAKESLPDLPVIMTAESGYPIGVHGDTALLLEPVSAEELMDAVHQLSPG
jgi:DNA-binding NtrC family response regulator